eukprot:TRINITY_DN6564_c0_g3_i1.p1 TRINITY_DN6564_c0_g3~~TRINITY_DN6564_c0_g3_i1.p1  ORF type:complete len:168 (-),score=12.50 TRINITY_DN6564_c0_g3_i1:47-550(-)
MEVYHEKQRLQRCALHTLNCLFQRAQFTKHDLDDIAYSLSPSSLINPHKSVLGTGNYDANVIFAALAASGYYIKWHDKRKPLSTIPFDYVFGIIVNTIAVSIFNIYQARHWFTVRPVDKIWYSFDSRFREPMPFASTDQLMQYLEELQRTRSAEIILVIKDGVQLPE